MRLRNVWISVPGLTCAVLLVSCGGGSPSTSSTSSGGASAPAGGSSGAKVDAATAGDVKGMVMVDGMVPMNAAIKMNADPVCVRLNKDPQFQETYAVGSDGKSLGNVFVYVKDGQIGRAHV